MDNMDYDNMDYIDSYFKGGTNDAQKEQFEKKILDDASFAEDVAFYISANGLIQQQVQEKKKQQFREIYEQRKVVSIKPAVKNIWRYMAAASVIAAVILSTWFLSGETSPQQMADNYTEQNWKTLSGAMGKEDSLQTGFTLYNQRKDSAALAIFENLVNNDPANDNLKIYAGKTSLRLNNYDKALRYFTMVETDTSLIHNPGKFFKAITLLKRNKSDDKEAAKLLLKEVRDQDLEEKDEAIRLLGKLK